MKIIFTASEMRPFAETGGLAEVIASLPKALQELGHEVKVFLPFYRPVQKTGFKFKKEKTLLLVPMGAAREHGALYKTVHKGIEVYSVAQNFYYDRPGLYGDKRGDYDDNDRRYTFFNRGVLEALKHLRFSPDIIHCNDWQTGLLPCFLKTLYKGEPLFKKTKSIFSIHNIAYQGNFHKDAYHITGLGEDEFTMDGLEFYGEWSFLKAGLVYADVITAVSEEYVKEIQTREYGFGMEGLLKHRNRDLRGVVNGIDTGKWNPEVDKDLKFNFSLKNIEGKEKNKTALQKLAKLKVDENIPLFGFVGRLTDQKGIDLIQKISSKLLKMNVEFIFLGTGDKRHEAVLKKLKKKDPKKMAVYLKYDPILAKQIFAASDFYLMPSRFEPCGLGQMIAMRYGTVPIVRATGGLKETVENFNEKTGKGNGLVFKAYKSEELMKMIQKAERLFLKKKTWAKMQTNCFKSDFSWARQAEKYIKIYKESQKKS